MIGDSPLKNAAPVISKVLVVSKMTKGLMCVTHMGKGRKVTGMALTYGDQGNGDYIMPGAFDKNKLK